MVTLTYSNVDGIERISDGLQTFERARINIKAGTQIVYVCDVHYPALREAKAFTCRSPYGVVLGREGDMYDIRLNSGDYTVFLSEIWERAHYAIFSTMHNVHYVAKLVERPKTWRPVSAFFSNFEEAKAWCDKRGITYNKITI
ncbi:MAG: hypothetical protein IKB68_06525 [Rikenellaceae bacterium]|nr:hypothetical protein [Rikenellaceae bacterium]